MRLFKLGKDVTAMLDYNPFSPQSEMEKMFPRCGNCRGTHWKKIKFLDIKKQRQMRSVLLQGDMFNPIPINKMFKGKLLYKSGRNI